MSPARNFPNRHLVKLRDNQRVPNRLLIVRPSNPRPLKHDTDKLQVLPPYIYRVTFHDPCGASVPTSNAKVEQVLLQVVFLSIFTDSTKCSMW